MLTDHERKGLKVIVGLAVKLAGGQENATNIASRIARHATFSDYGNTRLLDRQVPADVAVEIDQFNGKPLIVAKMAEMLGYKLVTLPRTRIAGSETGALVRLIKECGEAITAVSEQLQFGMPTHKLPDRDKVLKELDEAIEAALEVRDRLSPASATSLDDDE